MEFPSPTAISAAAWLPSSTSQLRSTTTSCLPSPPCSVSARPLIASSPSLSHTPSRPPAFRHALFHQFPCLRAHAGNIAEKIPQREETHEREAGTHATPSPLDLLLPSQNLSSIARAKAHLLDGKKMAEVHRVGKVLLGSENKKCRDDEGMGLSGSSSSRSGDRASDGKLKRTGESTIAGGTDGIMVKKKNKKSKANQAGFQLRIGLDKCSKTGDVMGALALYAEAVSKDIKLEQYHYNVLLYLCSSAAMGVVHPAKSGSSSSNSDSDGSSGMDWGDSDKSGEESCTNTPIQVSDDVSNFARIKGFQIYEKMCLENVPMSEAALTSVARMAMSMGNGNMAFEAVKKMKELDITPRLRSYDPALYSFCNSGDIEKAFEVERHMLDSGVYPEEPELEALLRVSVQARRGERVYYLLHKLRTTVRKVSSSTAELIETWFKSANASRVGKRKWDMEMVEQAIENGGGGWHGMGWLGKGKWQVTHTKVDADGVCMCCKEKLVTIDLDPVETEKFARSVETIASKRERNSSFQRFQRWLEYYGPFDAVIDAANVGLFSQRRFSLIKVNAVANGIRQKLPTKKWPLIILHNKRLTGEKMEEPLNAKLIQKWKNADAIYATPTGSNDDWYWLYAAIKSKSLIVTNDEMRDHIFQNLGNDFFSKWKERHQVRFSFCDGNFEFHMPPPCSVVIQESKEGHWHIPILVGHELEEERTWLCITRVNSSKTKESKGYPKEARPKQAIRSTSTSLQARSLFSVVGREQRNYEGDIMRSTQLPSSESKEYISIISDIEASEKLSDHVINFQI